MQVRCAKCSRPISLADMIELSAGRLSHLDCARARGLSPEERAMLFVYCSDHDVANCVPCDSSFRMAELGADLLGSRTNVCPRCRSDLTESVRAHLFSCVVLPSEMKRRAQDVRDAAQIVIKRSQELVDRADTLIREAEAHLLERQQALRALMKRMAER